MWRDTPVFITWKVIIKQWEWQRERFTRKCACCDSYHLIHNMLCNLTDIKNDIWLKVSCFRHYKCWFFLGRSVWSHTYFLSYLQILTPTSEWWLELPPWTPWCPAWVSCLQPSHRTYLWSRRSSTARAAPSSPQTPVSHDVTLILKTTGFTAPSVSMRKNHTTLTDLVI